MGSKKALLCTTQTSLSRRDGKLDAETNEDLWDDGVEGGGHTYVNAGVHVCVKENKKAYFFSFAPCFHQQQQQHLGKLSFNRKILEIGYPGCE